MVFAAFLIAGFVLPVALGTARRIPTRHVSLFLALFAAVFFALLLSWLPGVRDGESIEFAVGWSELAQLDLAFVIDPLALMFLLVITGVGSLVLLYSSRYFDDSVASRTVVTLIAVFMTAMAGLVAADNIVLLFIFWEMTTIISFLLIGSKHENGEARRSAHQALVITGGGGLALLAGLVALAFHTGEWTVSGMQEAGVPTGGLATAGTLLVMVGAFTKSAQFPFHFWLPNAMVAPSPVSSFLHSATMVKAGVFLLLRLTPVLGESGGLWFWMLTVTGGITMVVGAVEAVRHDDIKRILAMTTVNGLGTLVFLIGLGTPAALKAAVLFFIAHAVYKSGLFLAAGSIEHATGSRSLAAATGIGRTVPFAVLGVVVAAISMAGIPPTIGYVAKEVIFDATEHAPVASMAFTAVAWIAIFALIWASVRLSIPLIRSGISFAGSHREPVAEYLPILIPAFGGIVLGVAVEVLWERGAGSVVAQLTRNSVVATPHLWPGFTLALWLSLSVIVAGGLVGVYAALRYSRATARWSSVEALDATFNKGLAGLNASGTRLTTWLQNGALDWYVSVVVLTAVALLTASFIWLVDGTPGVSGDNSVLGWGLSAVIGISAYLSATTRSGFTAVSALGMMGFGVAIIYAMFNAPDLAITQILVETLLVILFLFVLLRLPLRSSRIPRALRTRNVIVALAGGLAMGYVAWSAGSYQSPETLGAYYAQESLPAAHGRNVVNTILVDFRAFDTLGEVIVLAIATVGFVALLRGRTSRGS